MESWEDKVNEWRKPLYLRWLSSLQPVFRFFYPKKIPGNVVSHIYVKAFRWTFFTVLILGLPYFFFLSESQFLHEILKNISLLLGNATHEGDYQIASKKININGVFMIFPLAYAWALLSRKLKEIPPETRDLNGKTILLQFTHILFLVAGALVIKIGKELESSPNISLYSLLLLFLFCATYGFIGVHLVRFLMDITAIVGLRKTKNSIWPWHQ